MQKWGIFLLSLISLTSLDALATTAGVSPCCYNFEGVAPVEGCEGPLPGEGNCPAGCEYIQGGQGQGYVTTCCEYNSPRLCSQKGPGGLGGWQTTTSNSIGDTCCRRLGGTKVTAALDGPYSNTWYCCKGGKNIEGSPFVPKCCTDAGGKVYTISSDTKDCCMGSVYDTGSGKQDCCASPKVIKSNSSGTACCDSASGDVYLVYESGSSSEPTISCCPANHTAYKEWYDPRNGSYSEACCPSTGKIVSNLDDMGVHGEGMVCCQSSSGDGAETYKISCCSTRGGQLYNNASDQKDCCMGATFTKTDYSTGCCEKAENLAAAGHAAGAVYACCKDSSTVDTDGITREGCCQLAGGVFMFNVSSSVPDQPQGDKLPDGDDGVCCEASSAKDIDGNVEEKCCTNVGGTWNDGTCCKGSMDLEENTRTKECCENANGMWKDTFCCATWGKKDGESCKVSSLPDDDSYS